MNAADEVTLRDWRPSDAPALTDCLNNTRILTQLPYSMPYPYTLRHARVFIGMTNCCDNKLEKAIEYNDMVVGGISLLPDDDIWSSNARLSFFLNERYQKKGIMHEAIRQVVRYAFSDFALERLYSYVLESNGPGSSVLEKSGFTREGILRKALLKDNKLQNVCLYSILKQE